MRYNQPMRVRVIHPPMSIARDFIDYPYFADLGAVQLAAVLMQAHHEIQLIDAYALPGSSLTWRSDGRAHLGAPVGEVLEACRGEPELTIVAYTPFHRPPARDDVLAELLQGLGGEGPIWLADCYQSGQHYVESDGVLAAYPEAGAWIKYEAETTIPELLRTGAKGIVAGREVEDLDALPPPAWELVDLRNHDRFCARVVENLGRGGWAFPIDGRTLPMVTTRGCPFTCAHCSSNPGNPAVKRQRRLSREVLCDRIKNLMQVHQATRIEVLDELINVNASHFDAFLDAGDHRFDVPNGMRADYLTLDHFRRMRGRVTTVSVSAESGVQRVVDEIVKKQLDLGAITRAAQNAQTAGVPLMVHFMIGLPGESAEEVNATLAYATELFDKYGAQPAVQFATPLPGTQLAKGRSLPVVDDWGPRFQVHPSQPGAIDAATLRKFKWTFDERLRHSQGPKKLIMNVTYVCNNHCTFCAVGTRTQVHGHPPRQREHLDKYRRMGVTMVDFDGGEPTLNPELIPLVRYSRAIGYERINVTTNGRMCFYPEFAQKLVRSGLTTLLFSVHGADAQTHAQQVGVAEAFEQTTGGIRNCVAAKPAGVELGMNITLTKGNYLELDGVAQLAWDLGLRWLNIQFLTPFGRATRMVAPDTQAAADVARGVIEKWQAKMKIQIINLPFCFLPGYEHLMMGDLGKLERHMVFVNNEDVNLAQYLAERRTRKPVCATCPHAVFCGGFYELDEVPEPPWLISTEDLLRAVE
jgi:MoaA/NifB/PqqE/SkfB family radical SAM enzyme